MDLSIRVIAFNTFLRPKSLRIKAPTPIGCPSFKDRFAAPFRLIRQQQRGEIMKNSPNFVKHFVQLFFSTPSPLTPPKTPGTARERALYTLQMRRQLLRNRIWTH